MTNSSSRDSFRHHIWALGIDVDDPHSPLNSMVSELEYSNKYRTLNREQNTQYLVLCVIYCVGTRMTKKTPHQNLAPPKSTISTVTTTAFIELQMLHLITCHFAFTCYYCSKTFRHYSYFFVGKFLRNMTSSFISQLLDDNIVSM